MLKECKRVMVLDVHASESGALSILTDFHQQVMTASTPGTQWEFVVSTPSLEHRHGLTVRKFPWVKKSIVFRMYFDLVVARRLVKKFHPDLIINLQNMPLNFSSYDEVCYLHLPFVLTEYKFSLLRDEFRLWFYQRIYSFFLFRALRKCPRIIVQTKWMLESLVRKAGVSVNDVLVIPPKLNTDFDKVVEFKVKAMTGLFYPATPFSYKDHNCIVDAMHLLKQRGIKLPLTVTFSSKQNSLSKKLHARSKKLGVVVRFEGTLQRSEVIDYYRKNVLVFSSVVESFGLPLLEARRLGVAIVAADTEFAREILDGYSRVFFYESHNSVELSCAIETALSCDLTLRQITDGIPSRNIDLIDLIG